MQWRHGWPVLGLLAENVEARRHLLAVEREVLAPHHGTRKRTDRLVAEFRPCDAVEPGDRIGVVDRHRVAPVIRRDGPASMGAAHTFQEVLDFDNGGLKPFCSVRWASIEEDETRKEEDSGYVLLTLFQVYFVIILLLEYLAPLSFITLAYLKMGMKLWWTITPGQADQLRDDKILRNKKKVRPGGNSRGTSLIS